MLGWECMLCKRGLGVVHFMHKAYPNPPSIPRRSILLARIDHPVRGAVYTEGYPRGRIGLEIIEQLHHACPEIVKTTEFFQTNGLEIFVGLRTPKSLSRPLLR